MRKPAEKFDLLFEVVRRSLLAAQMYERDLKRDVGALEPIIDAQGPIEDRVAGPLLAAMAFVDSCHRFFSVVDALPLVNKRAPALREVASIREAVEKARNHLQHMRHDLSTPAPIDYPILGSLAWARGQSSWTIFLSQTTQATVLSLVFDTQKWEWVAACIYSVRDTSVDVDATLAALVRVYEWITTSDSFPQGCEPELKWGPAQAFGYHMMLAPDGESGEFGVLASPQLPTSKD